MYRLLIYKLLFLLLLVSACNSGADEANTETEATDYK